MRYLHILALVLSTVVPSAASAQTCAETFPARLERARASLKAWSKENAEYKKYLASPEGKAITFFTEHCRFLSQLEIAIRKLDDPMSFVCDPTAGKKPKALTTRLLAESGGNVGPSLHGTEPENLKCQHEDPISLAITNDFEDRENFAKTGIVLCHEDPRKDCQELIEIANQQLDLLRKQREFHARSGQ